MTCPCATSYLASWPRGSASFQSKPSTAFSPVAVTPDELGAAWADGKVHLPVLSDLNGNPFGTPDAGVDMTFDFGDLICHAARTRPLCAGSIIGSGTVSNKGSDGSPGTPVADGGAGYSCIAEMRMVETIRTGRAHTPFMSFGDVVDIRMIDRKRQFNFRINHTEGCQAPWLNSLRPPVTWKRRKSPSTRSATTCTPLPPKAIPIPASSSAMTVS